MDTLARREKASGRGGATAVNSGCFGSRGSGEFRRRTAWEREGKERARPGGSLGDVERRGGLPSKQDVASLDGMRATPLPGGRG